MITKARIEKIEQKIALTQEEKNREKYQYIFHNHEEFEEAKKQCLIDLSPSAHIILIDL